MTNTAVALRNDKNSSSTELAKCLPLVKSITARLRLSHAPCASFDDVYEAGIDGLMQAAERFDPARGASFTTFAYYRIRGAILDSVRRGPLRESSGAPRRQAVVGDRPTLAVAANDNGHFDPPHEPSGDRPTWQLAESVFTQLTSLDDITSLADDSLPVADDEVERHRVQERVAAALSALPEIERRVVELHYYEDLSFAEIGQRLGICKPWAFKLHRKALRQLREALAELDENDDAAVA